MYVFSLIKCSPEMLIVYKKHYPDLQKENKYKVNNNSCVNNGKENNV